ncbi:MAG: hypothetical protein JWQ35_334 [Bacteriovoracaceae bacterium]|nr:hypothetical protein [Bacteriovoracaceae bacterium]
MGKIVSVCLIAALLSSIVPCHAGVHIPTAIKKSATICTIGILLLGEYEVRVRDQYKNKVEDLRSKSTEKWNGFERLNHGKLNTFWVQEYIGVDLVRAELKNSNFPNVGVASIENQIDLNQIPADRLNRWSNFTSLSSANSNHATGVANLIVGENTGASEKANMFVFHYGSLSSAVKVINVSAVYRFTDSKSFDAIRKIFQLWTDKGRIFVFSAGNQSPVGIVKPFYQKFFPPPSNVEVRLPGIIVGSIDPEGERSKFSVLGDDVTIAVPADLALQSRTSGLSFFDCSSATAPLVTGTLADIISVLGELNLEEAKILLKRTSIKVHGTENIRGRNGFGMLNSYRAYKVALRLSTKNWQNLNAEERRLLLLDPSVYDFSDESAGLWKQSKIAFSNHDSLIGLDLLRKAFLLNPEEKKANELSDFYSSKNLITNAKFYSRLARLQPK